jgi:hypothetical protein
MRFHVPLLGHGSLRRFYIVKSTLARRLGLPALFLSGAVFGSTITGVAFAAYQPHMQAALTALTNAKAQLVAAVPDKGGHRDAAINLVNQAITQVKAGVAYANVH